MSVISFGNEKSLGRRNGWSGLLSAASNSHHPFKEEIEGFLAVKILEWVMMADEWR